MGVDASMRLAGLIALVFVGCGPGGEADAGTRDAGHRFSNAETWRGCFVDEEWRKDVTPEGERVTCRRTVAFNGIVWVPDWYVGP